MTKKYVPICPQLPTRSPLSTKHWTRRKVPFFMSCPQVCDPLLPPLINECPYLASSDVTKNRTNISVHITDRSRTFKLHKKRKYCYFPSSNLIHITTLNHVYKVNKEMILPCFFLLNSRSLLPKLDELTALLSFKPIDIIAITESWLHELIDSSLLSINDYNLFRKDRATGRGGGVCAYIKKDIPCIRRVDLESENLECLWLSIRPKRLPRLLSGIAICVVYHPPGLTISEHNDLNEYLTRNTCMQ